MNTTVNSWAVIRARIAEWQRQYHDSDYRPVDFLFGSSFRAEYLNWLRHT